jgi:dTDP-4-amino-4,6-dideoxygalactose transaminase
LLGEVPGVRLLGISPEARHVHHLMVVRTSYREGMLEGLKADGIEASVHYPVPIHLEPAWDGRGRRGQFRNAEVLASTVLSLPLFPGITDEQIDRCVERVAALSQTSHRISSLRQPPEILESA